MPELPDITVYIAALERYILGRTLEKVLVVNPFVLRSVDPPLSASHGLTVTGLRRLGKRIVVVLEGDLFLIIHLMIAGRLKWFDKPPKPNRRLWLAAFVFGGIGNANSDEILHAAKLSPMMLTMKMTDYQVTTLFAAARSTLRRWIDLLSQQTCDGLPDKVTAFRPEMAVHGKFGQPCPDCQAPVQRIRYADNEADYCARCQTGGRRLADRGMSRLMGDDWPRDMDEL